MKRWRFLAWMVAGPLAVLGAMLAAAHPYLAVTERSGANVLVVEGWMEPGQLAQVPRWIDSLHYTHVYTTGTLRPFSYYLKNGDTLEVSFAAPRTGSIELRVGGLPGAGFAVFVEDSRIAQEEVDTQPNTFNIHPSSAISHLRIVSMNRQAMDSHENNLFIQWARIGGEDLHQAGSTTILPASGQPYPGWPSYANKCAADLRDLGVRVPVVAVPAPGRPDSRSWANASWFGVRAKTDKLVACDVITVGVHARRTRALYQRACGPDVRVGVIALTDPRCASDDWWRHRDGWVLMLKEIGGSTEPLAVDLTR